VLPAVVVEDEIIQEVVESTKPKAESTPTTRSFSPKPLLEKVKSGACSVVDKVKSKGKAVVDRAKTLSKDVDAKKVAAAAVGIWGVAVGVGYLTAGAGNGGSAVVADAAAKLKK
jgi:hypothetical protein